MRVLTVCTAVLFAIAVRALFVGYSSIEPVLFAELYVLSFGFVLFWLLFARTARYASGGQILAMLVGAFAGVLLVVKVTNLLGIIPRTWEPDYCGDLSYPDGGVDFRLPPKTFRCVSVPIMLAGWFIGWWIAYWIMARWKPNR